MKRLIFILPTLALSASCLADDAATIINSGQNNSGVVSLNQAAGVGNQQLNLRSLTIGGEGGLANTEADQSIALNKKSYATAQAMKDAAHSASINGSAFSGNRGIIGINQSAGAFNQMSNQASINLDDQKNTSNTPNSIYILDNTALTKTSAGGENSKTDNKQSNNNIYIDDTAFKNTSGVVQVNQVAGVMNQAVNAVTVNVIAQTMGH
ncbi:hypothetical protein QU487_02050 [Crenobacter sp. SG2305]|uniref:hypothetical protein n=1 Tax=Crenobacter oryzisoli TaxID=3056844 RepID=UPI0025AA65DB|nr:hypothetical protein [Crenobacter sp. SG2305]MDN0081542.1 hypothetical protein [Crenobacter sp. SG2305]